MERTQTLLLLVTVTAVLVTTSFAAEPAQCQKDVRKFFDKGGLCILPPGSLDSRSFEVMFSHGITTTCSDTELQAAYQAICGPLKESPSMFKCTVDSFELYIDMLHLDCDAAVDKIEKNLGIFSEVYCDHGELMAIYQISSCKDHPFPKGGVATSSDDPKFPCNAESFKLFDDAIHLGCQGFASKIANFGGVLPELTCDKVQVAQVYQKYCGYPLPTPPPGTGTYGTSWNTRRPYTDKVYSDSRKVTEQPTKQSTTTRDPNKPLPCSMKSLYRIDMDCRDTAIRIQRNQGVSPGIACSKSELAELFESLCGATPSDKYWTDPASDKPRTRAPPAAEPHTRVSLSPGTDGTPTGSPAVSVSDRVGIGRVYDEAGSSASASPSVDACEGNLKTWFGKDTTMCNPGKVEKTDLDSITGLAQKGVFSKCSSQHLQDAYNKMCNSAARFAFGFVGVALAFFVTRFNRILQF